MVVKKVKFLLITLFMGISLMLTSCESKLEENNATEKEIIVSLALTHFDVEVTDEPISSRAGVEDEFTYLVQVRKYNANTSSYENYAHGVFNSGNIQIKLTEGKKYSFEVALFKDYFKSGYIATAYYNTNAYYYEANNEFVYNNMIFSQLHPGITDKFRTSNGGRPSKFMGETYYGEVNEYEANIASTVNIDLSRVSTYLNVIVNGMTEGKVVSTDMGMDFSIEYPNTTYSTWITDSKYQNGKDSFNQTLLLTYINSKDEETRLIYDTFTFKRIHKKNIIINLKSKTPVEFSSNFSINISDSELNVDEDITVDCEI